MQPRSTLQTMAREAQTATNQICRRDTHTASVSPASSLVGWHIAIVVALSTYEEEVYPVGHLHLGSLCQLQLGPSRLQSTHAPKWQCVAVYQG